MCVHVLQYVCCKCVHVHMCVFCVCHTCILTYVCYMYICICTYVYDYVCYIRISIVHIRAYTHSVYSIKSPCISVGLSATKDIKQYY